MGKTTTRRRTVARWGRAACLLGLLNALGACNAVTASGRSSRIGLLATRAPAGRVVVLKQQVQGEDCPGDGEYADYGEAIERAIASVRGANILVNVTLESAEETGLGGVGICVRATGDAGRLE